MNFKNNSFIKKITKSLLVFGLFWYSSYFQLIPILLFHLKLKSLSESTLVMLSTFSSFIVFIILLFIYRKSLKKEFLKFKNNFYENIHIGFKYWTRGLVVMFVSNIILLVLFKSGGANNENAVQSMIKSLPWLMIINAGILAPINEEIVFRKALKDVIKNKYLFVILSFLLFGGAHVISSADSLLDYLYIIPYGALGASFAVIYNKTDTVFAPLTIHMIHNTILALISILTL